MAPLLAELLACCQRVLRGEAEQLGQLQVAGFVCAPGSWQFELPALHGYLCRQLPPGTGADYRAFLRQLYASDLNSRLAALGAQMVVLDNRGKVSRSRYALQPL